MRSLALAALFFSAAVSVRAEEAPPEPALLALGQMLREAQQREATALIRAVTAERRADQAEARVKAQHEAPPP